MEQYFELMHKDTVCAAMLLETVTGEIRALEPLQKEAMPFFGTADITQMYWWWSHRAVPGSREEMAVVFREAGCLTPKEYLVKNLALSLTDTYWIRPVESDLSWKDVNLYQHAHMTTNFVPYHNATSFDPNASLGGQMTKYWDLTEEPPVLVKEASHFQGQQAVNECFASMLHQFQPSDIAYVRYSQRRNEQGFLCSTCPAFTSEKLEFIPAYDIVLSQKGNNSTTDYDQFISICAQHGLDRDVMQKFMDYQTLTDFVISNTDEHLLNFGVLRDPDTLALIGPAPVFDSGNSMFYTEWIRTKPFSRTELLSRKITAVVTSEEKLLHHVKYRDVVDVSALPSRTMVQEFYMQYGIPEEHAAFIAGNYETKKQMLEEFQRGLQISLYHEKQKERKLRSSDGNNTPS
ncbi:MAG: hypothetical protein SOH60_05910 [Lachnospiraceae bacterium]|jgi:hypothetical protein